MCLEYGTRDGAAWGPWVQGETGWEGEAAAGSAAHLADGILSLESSSLLWETWAPENLWRDGHV